MSAEPRDEGPVRGLTVALAGVAALGIEAALAQPVPPSAAGMAAALGLTAAAGLTLRLRRRRAGGSAALGGLIALCVLDLVRVTFQYALPLELTMFALFRDVALVLAALSDRPVLLRCAGGLSTALVLGAACLVEDWVGIVLVSGFGVVGSLWLCFLYWGLVRRDLLPGTAARLPIASAAVLWAVLAGALACAAVGPRRALAALGELVPTSGGTQGYDPRSRGGVNDGDSVTEGHNQPQSVGLVRSDIFLDSDGRCLYDAANDLYGPPRKNKYQQKAVALSSVDVRHNDRAQQNRQASRQFALERQRAATPDRPRPHASDAQLFVTGPTPLHLRLVAYAGINAEALEEAPPPASRMALRQGPQGWLTLPAASAAFFAGEVRHEIKLSRLEANQLPSPAHLTGFRIDRVDRCDLFRWSQEGVVAMGDGKVPVGTVVEVESRTVDPELLRTAAAPPRYPPTLPVYRDASAVSTRVQELAVTWAGNLPEGWARVEAVVSRLRAGYAQDRGATVPEGCDDPLGHFLLESRRGPDFLFATSAAALLRVLGLPTRVVWGFYARPDRYDAATGHTPVLEEDLHFWTEVWLPGDEWVVVEPTPGYELLPPARPWWRRLAASLAAAGDWSREHPGLLGLAAAGVVLLAWRRRDVADRLATLRWRVGTGAAPRRLVLATLGLLERRGRRAGLPRPRGRTARAWYGALAAAVPQDPDKALSRFVELADWAAYAPESFWQRLPRVEEEVRRSCRQAVRRWDLRSLRRLAARK